MFYGQKDQIWRLHFFFPLAGSEKASLREASPAPDRRSPDLQKSDQDAKEESADDDIALDESDSEEPKKEIDQEDDWRRKTDELDPDRKPCRKKKTRTVFSRDRKSVV